MNNLSTAVLSALNISLAQATPWSFFEFNRLPLFEPFRRRGLPTLLGLTTGVALAPDRIVHDALPSTKLPLGHMHYPSSLGVTFGYVIELPSCEPAVFPHDCSILMPQAKKRSRFEAVRLVHQNPHINVFWSEDGAMLINFQDRNTFFDPSFLRGGH